MVFEKPFATPLLSSPRVEGVSFYCPWSKQMNLEMPLKSFKCKDGELKKNYYTVYIHGIELFQLST